MNTVTATQNSTLGPLARQEIRNYLRSRLFWVGAALLALMSYVGLTGPDDRFSTVGDGLVPAAVIGLLGIIVMAGMTRNSDRAAAAAGAVAVPQRTRTLALASAVVVPATAGLLWFATAIVGYHLHPPAADAIPFGPVGDGFVYAGMFVEGVMACIGGPVLGLVIGRWLPGRGVAPVVAVVLVPVTIVMQPLFESVERWRVFWVWVHFYGPVGVDGDADRAAILTGSPYLHIAYLAALCVLGVLVALHRDPESDRSRLRTAILGVVAVAAVLAVLSMLGGEDERVPNPIPSSSATS